MADKPGLQLSEAEQQLLVFYFQTNGGTVNYNLMCENFDLKKSAASMRVASLKKKIAAAGTDFTADGEGGNGGNTAGTPKTAKASKPTAATKTGDKRKQTANDDGDANAEDGVTNGGASPKKKANRARSKTVTEKPAAVEVKEEPGFE